MLLARGVLHLFSNPASLMLCTRAAARHFTAGVFGGLICPLVALMGVESGRYGAIGFSSWFVLLAELCNSASVGLIAAAVWLPLYLRRRATRWRPARVR